MVARPWNWDFAFMLTHFGWKAVLGIGVANGLVFALCRADLAQLAARPLDAAETVRASVPAWVTAVHLAFMAWTVAMAHYPVLFLGGFLFFLAGLVIHGGLQGWWIAPTLASLTEVPLFFGAALLTALNDNALITYLATLVPDLGTHLQYAVVAGAVSGGGLTVIANAPNPAGQAILGEYFADGISPLGLLAAAALPTVVVGACLLLL
jgi:hypothetical protein